MIDLVGDVLIGSIVLFLLLQLAYRWRLVWGAAAYRREMPSVAPSPAENTSSHGYLPPLELHLPVYNEPIAVGGLLRAVAALDYPRDRLQVRVLDDSTDETSERIHQHVTSLRRGGLAITHEQRPHREGFKAGALNEALNTATAPWIVVLDADFRPQRGFLRSLFDRPYEDEVAFIQAQWGFVNERDTVWTRMQAVLLRMHFLVEQPGRAYWKYPIAFNGTAGAWRRDALNNVGGWQSDTITEDLHVALLAQRAHWLAVYRADVIVPSELPERLSDWRRQQARWTVGALQVWSRLGLKSTRLAEALHLSAPASYLSAGLLLVLSWLGVVSMPGRLDLLISVGYLLLPLGMPVRHAWLHGVHLGWWIAAAPVVLIMGCVHTAWFFIQSAPVFERTPKGKA